MTPSSTIEFLIWLLIAASVIAVVAARLKIPYTVALVLGGLLLGSLHLHIAQSLFVHPPDWLTAQISLIIFLPALLFEGSLKIQFRHLRDSLVPICLLATIGVLAATLISGFALHWTLGIPVLIALVFGAIVAATDPISALAIFKDMPVDRRLAVIIEGESLFNDGTAVVLFGILFAAVTTSHLAISTGLWDFAVEVAGGAAVGASLGYAISKLTQRVDDPEIEIMFTTVLAYGSYLLAQSFHLSGVIATVAAGLMVGNFGVPDGMSPRTRVSLWAFWEYASFLINSILFLLIGLQVRLGELFQNWRPAIITVLALLLGRALVVYGMVPIGNLFSTKISLRWQHVMVWGGMRGALSLALVLSLGRNFPYQEQLLTMTFAVVAFTVIVQGITIKPLIRLLGIGRHDEDDDSRARVQQIAIASSLAELEGMAARESISRAVYRQLRDELDARLDEAGRSVDAIYNESHLRRSGELQAARARLAAAEKSAIEQAMRNGLVNGDTASKMIAAAGGRDAQPDDASVHSTASEPR